MSQYSEIEFFQGEDAVVTVQVDAGGLTGYAFAFTVRKREGETPVIEKTTAGGGVVILSDTSLAVDLDAGDLTIDSGSYIFAVSRTTSGAHAVLAHGVFKVKRSAAF